MGKDAKSAAVVRIHVTLNAVLDEQRSAFPYYSQRTIGQLWVYIADSPLHQADNRGDPVLNRKYEKQNADTAFIFLVA